MSNGNLASTIKAVRYPDRMDATVEERFTLFEQSTGEDLFIVNPEPQKKIILRTYQRHQSFRLQSRRPGSWIAGRVVWRSDVRPPSD